MIVAALRIASPSLSWRLPGAAPVRHFTRAVSTASDVRQAMTRKAIVIAVATTAQPTSMRVAGSPPPMRRRRLRPLIASA